MITRQRKVYLTKEGLKRIKKEYEDLKKIWNAKAKNEPEVLHSEEINPEYLSFFEDVGFLEARITELENILRNYTLIKKPPKEKQNVVDLGATVVLETPAGLDEFTIVGSFEANPSVGKISNESPIGKMLLGKKVGDVVEINSPIKAVYKIKKIKYNIS